MIAAGVFFEGAGQIMPATEVCRPPVAILIGGEEKIFAFVLHTDRIGCGSMGDMGIGPGRTAGIGIVEIHGIAISSGGPSSFCQ